MPDPPLRGATVSGAVSTRVRAALIAAFTLAAAFVYARIYFGVVLMDEAFHVVVPYRYVLGAQPFVDEVNLAQGAAGVLAVPFVALYEAVAGRDGIVLFSRHLLILFNAAVAACVFVSLRTMVASRWLCGCAAMLAFAFIPIDVSLNYNALGNGFFVAGTFLGLAHVQTGRRAFAIAAGLAHGLAFFSYPPFGVALLAYAVCLFLVGGRSWRTVLAYVAAAALPCLAWFALLVLPGLDDAVDLLSAASDLKEAGRDDTGLIDRAIVTLKDGASGFVLAPLAFLALAVAVRVRESRPRLALACLVAVPLLALPVRPVTYASISAATHYVANLGVLALPLLLWMREAPLVRRLLVGAFIPGAVAGAVASYSTYTGGSHQGVGFSTAAIAAVLLLGFVAHDLAARTRRLDPTVTAILVGLVPVFAVIAVQFGSAAHEEKPFRLDARIDRGPYAGLLTTAENRRFVADVEQELAAVSSPDCRLVSYHGFPAGYLLSDSEPYTNTAWLGAFDGVRAAQMEPLLRYYRREGAPDIALRVKRIPFYVSQGEDKPKYEANDPLDAYLRDAGLVRTVNRDDFEIYVRRDRRCGSR